MINPEPQITLDAPIPGEGLTHELGDRPWQKPAQFTKIEEVIPLYEEKILDEEFLPQLLNVIETGFPLTTIANAMQSAFVMEGVHSVDVGMLALPAVVELLITVAEKKDVPYNSGLKKMPENMRNMEATMMPLVMKELEEKNKIKKEEPEEEDLMVEEEPAQTGLMARRV